MIVSQSIEDFKRPEFIRAERNDFHKHKSNNWLKLHGKPIRRKPFKKLISPLLFDEAWMTLSQTAISFDFFSSIKGNGYIIGQHDPGKPVSIDIFNPNGRVITTDGTKISNYKSENGCVIRKCDKCNCLPIEVYPNESSRHQYRCPGCNKTTQVWDYLQGARYEWNEEIIKGGLKYDK